MSGETLHNHIWEKDQERMPIVHALRALVSPVLERNIPKDARRVVEIGCGTGYFYRELLPDSLKVGTIGVDNDFEAIQRFREEAADAKAVRADLGSLPFGDGEIDAVIGLAMYAPIVYGKDILPEVKRVLKPGGKLILFQDTQIKPDTKSIGYQAAVDSGLATSEVERIHFELLREAAKSGFLIAEGRSMLQICITVRMEDWKKKIPQVEFDRLQAHMTPSELLLGYVSDRGRAISVSAPSKYVSLQIARVEGEFGIPGKLARLKLKPGDNCFEFVRMRYIVVQKT